jgi:hypothetical protein
MDLSNANQIADSLLAAIGGKQYILAMAVALVGVVKGVRWVAPKLHDKTGAWLNSDRGGAILSLIMGVAGGAATATAAGKPLSLSLILSGIMVSATGSGLFNLTKRVAKPSDKADAPAAPPAVPPVAPTVAILLIGLMGLAGCKLPPPCTAATANEARCKAQNVAVDCAAPEVIKIVEDIVGQVASALANNDYSKLLDTILADLTKRGQADGLGILTCAIQKVQAKPAASATASAVVVHGNAYMAAHPVKAKAVK